MTDAPPKDQQQFEQVLNRLDALIKRSHSGVAELPAAVESAALELIPPFALISIGTAPLAPPIPGLEEIDQPGRHKPRKHRRA